LQFAQCVLYVSGAASQTLLCVFTCDLGLGSSCSDASVL